MENWWIILPHRPCLHWCCCALYFYCIIEWVNRMHHYYSSWSLEQAPTCPHPGYSNCSLPRCPALVYSAEYGIISVNIWCAARALAGLAGQVYNAGLLLDSADSLVCSRPEHKVLINSLYEKSPLLLLIYSLGFRPQPWMLIPLTCYNKNWYTTIRYHFCGCFEDLRVLAKATGILVLTILDNLKWLKLHK
jgi:hypothetical protein